MSLWPAAALAYGLNLKEEDQTVGDWLALHVFQEPLLLPCFSTCNAERFAFCWAVHLHALQVLVVVFDLGGGTFSDISFAAGGWQWD
jgi:hypothetical protein